MKKDIHPIYFPDAVIKCACGKIFQIGSAVKQMEIEICSQCHPFYTGQEKLIDIAGRVEKFKARVKKAESSPKKIKKVRKTKSPIVVSKILKSKEKAVIKKTKSSDN